jgi:hypothetical protein
MTPPIHPDSAVAAGPNDRENCGICEKDISADEYVVHWGSCRECWNAHVHATWSEPTPGPWSAGPVDIFGDVNITGPEDALAIAAVVSNMRPRGQVIANARLIAAAPDLLAALEAILADVGDVSMDGYHEGVIHSDEVNAARAALAKARGEG